MSGKDAREPASALSQQAQRDPHVPRGLADLLGVARLATEVYLNTEQACQYVGSPSRQAFIKWARRHDVPLRKPRGGRRLVVRKGDLDFVLKVR